MTTTLHTIVGLTRDVLEAATLPGAPTVYVWRTTTHEPDTLPAIDVLCTQATDAPQGMTMGPAQWRRSFVLSVVAWPAPGAADEAMGSDAVELAEAILDALFASKTWCDQMGQCPQVDTALQPERSADARYCAIGIAIRGEHDIQRAYATPAYNAAIVHYTNEEAGGAEPEGETTP